MPNDPFILDMDPFQKLWMFHNWLADQDEHSDLAKDHAYLVGSFIDPEAVQKLIGNEKDTFSTDEEFEESINMVKEAAKMEEQLNNTKRRRRVK